MLKSQISLLLAFTCHHHQNIFRSIRSYTHSQFPCLTSSASEPGTSNGWLFENVTIPCPTSKRKFEFQESTWYHMHLYPTHCYSAFQIAFSLYHERFLQLLYLSLSVLKRNEALMFQRTSLLYYNQSKWTWYFCEQIDLSLITLASFLLACSGITEWIVLSCFFVSVERLDGMKWDRNVPLGKGSWSFLTHFWISRLARIWDDGRGDMRRRWKEGNGRRTKADNFCSERWWKERRWLFLPQFLFFAI